MNYQANIPLKDHTTMKLGGPADYFVSAHSKNDLVKAVAWAEEKKLPILVIGGGSNIIVTDAGFRGLVIKNELKGIYGSKTDDGIILTANAGQSWDELVEHSVSMGLSGIEALSLIPGTVGATPVQNVGAYGQEVADTIVEVEVYDRSKHEFAILENEDCDFGYRDSIFKHSGKDRYIITSVSYRMHRQQMQHPLYRSLEEHLKQHEVTETTPYAIRQAVIAIRSSKLPDPAEIANTGSFFHNPIISQHQYDSLREQYPDIPGHTVAKGIKVPAGWLVENAGFGNYQLNGMATYEKHALVLVNQSAKSYQALEEIASTICNKVETLFNISLTQEPELISP